MLQKCKSHLKILGAWRVTWSKYHTKDPQVLGSTVQNLVATATWRPGFVHRCSKCKRRLVMVCIREPVWEIISQHCALMQNAVSQPTLSVGQSCARTVRRNCHGALRILPPSLPIRGTKTPLSQPLRRWTAPQYRRVITKGSCKGAQITGRQICTV